MKLTEETIKKLLKLPTGNIADNNNSVPHQGVMDSGIKPVNPASKMAGRAFTAQCYPGDNLGLHQAIYAAKPGDVLVIDCHGYTQAGHFGDIMATACKEYGLAGVIIDGSCRDSEDIRALNFPVFVRAFNPSGTVKESLAKLGVPVTVGGIQVHTGDFIFGDCDGVVVVPPSEEDTVLEKALQKYEKEQLLLAEIAAGKTTLELYGFDKLIRSKSSGCL